MSQPTPDSSGEGTKPEAAAPPVPSTPRTEVKCEGCDLVIGRAKSDAEALAIFKDHLISCPYGGVRRAKRPSNTGLGVAIIVGIAALGVAILGLNPAAVKYLVSLTKETDSKTGASEGAATK